MTELASEKLLEVIDDAEITSQVEAMAAPEEMCAKQVVEKAKQMRKFHQEVRWRIVNGSSKVVAVGND